MIAKPTVQNVVASFSLTPAPLDLKKIHHSFKKESIWNKATFNYKVVILRLKKPKMSFLIYRTGRIICTGAKRVKDAERSADYLLERLTGAGFYVKRKADAKIRNIVATADLGIEVDLERFVSRVNKMKGVGIIYEPEQFPAAIVKISLSPNDNATVLLFSTGKLVCVGLKKEREI